MHWFDDDCNDLSIDKSDQGCNNKNKHYEPGIPPRRRGREIVIDEGNPCVESIHFAAKTLEKKRLFCFNNTLNKKKDNYERKIGESRSNKGLVAVLVLSAKRFVEEGAKVVLGDIQDDVGQKVAEELGSAAIYVHCDVTQEDQVAGMVDTAVENFGQLDVMYNNAGLSGPISNPRRGVNARLTSTLTAVFTAATCCSRNDTP